MGSGFSFLLFGPFDALAAEADLALVGIDTEDLHFDLVPDFHHVLGVLDLADAEDRAHEVVERAAGPPFEPGGRGDAVRRDRRR